MRRISKAIGAALGGVTGAGVAAVLGAAGVEVAPEVAGAVATLLGAVGAWLAPRNAEPASGARPDR